MTQTVPDNLPAYLGGRPAVTSPWLSDWPMIGDEEISAVVELMRKRVLSIYDRSGIIAEFEDAFARYHAVDGQTPYALTHNAGTSALHAAFFGVGVKAGSEVIAPTYTFLATVTPILQCHGIPVLAEMDAQTLTVDPLDVERRITPRTRAVVVTHVWGHPCDMDRLVEICRRRGLALIEDCSHAHGATYRGRRVGTFGDAACFSLEGHKAMVAGEGGMLLTNDRRIYERALLLGHFGRRLKQEIQLPEHKPYVDTGLGQKYRMHPLAAAIALVQLRHLDQRNEMRRRNLDSLTKRLAGIPGVRPPVTLPHVTRGGYYGYKPRYVREELSQMSLDLYLEALRAEGVQVKRPGSRPLHQLPIFRSAPQAASVLGFPWRCNDPQPAAVGGGWPVADTVYPTLLSLPTFTLPATETVEQYALAFRKVAQYADAIVKVAG